MDSLTTIWGIVGLYLTLNLAVGVYCHIKIKDSTDYLLAGRRIGVLMTAGTLAATEIGGGSTVGVAAKAYGSWGLSAGWYVVSAGIGVILVAFIAPLLRRAMATTVPEIIGRRFGSASHLITSILSMLATITLAGVQITATATIISVLTGLSTDLSILICGTILVLYTMSGGMWSVTMTDIIHFFVLVGGFIMAFFAFMPAVLGLVALTEFPAIEANNAVATVALHLMPPIIAGLVMAAVVSATLSSGAGDLLGAGIWSIVLGSVAGVVWEYLSNPYGIMSIIFGSFVSLVVFVIVVLIEKRMGKPSAPPAILE